MASDYKVLDKRNKKEELDDPRNVAPASLTEEIAEVRIKPEECFVHPSSGRIIVQEDVALDRVGRIIIPDKVKKRPTTGIILEIGKGIEDYEVGDKIVYGLYSGTVLTFKGWNPKTRINFRILNVDEILAKVDKDTPELEGVGV